ncbi:hypothetical protein P5673_008146 [Acropora cervicornis]|uniref:Uncharacterized protein n=1 Tax=Acropora cervicornis TaxID=6130 RepID=A0AAD9VB05_ACRCE|nr:hypothetical protein P5673_008146 [Acropora cervicornis]
MKCFKRKDGGYVPKLRFRKNKQTNYTFLETFFGKKVVRSLPTAAESDPDFSADRSVVKLGFRLLILETFR